MSVTAPPTMTRREQSALLRIPMPLLPPTLDGLAPRDGRPSLYRAGDGALLTAITYEPRSAPRAWTLVYLHGIESHAAWFALVAPLLAESGIRVVCLERRGCGRSLPELPRAHARNTRQLWDDVRMFITNERNAGHRIALAGLSWGGKLALSFALREPRLIERLFVINPGLVARVDLPGWRKLQVATSAVIRPRQRFRLPLRPAMFSKRKPAVDYIKRDPLRAKSASARFLTVSRMLDMWLAKQVSRRTTPTVAFLSDDDEIIDTTATLERLQRGSGPLEVHQYPFAHALQFEAPRAIANEIILTLDQADATTP